MNRRKLLAISLPAAAATLIGSGAFFKALAGPEVIVAKPSGYRIAHVLVCLCDNVHQSILKVPEKIGNGRDLANNLYWGNSEGVVGIFDKAPAWKRVARWQPEGSDILERRIYLNKSQRCLLLVDAYAGEAMKACLTSHLAYLAGLEALNVSATETTPAFPAGGQADFVGFIGHNGLMDFQLSTPERKADAGPKSTAIFCCHSARYFSPHLATLQVKPLCLTRQNMYPGSFLMREVLAAWLENKSAEQCTAAAAAAYAKNQKISFKAASGVFTSKALE